MVLGDFRTVHTRQLWEQFVGGSAINAETLPDYVYRAWVDCRDNSVNPRQAIEARTLPDAEFATLLDSNSELVEISKPVLDMILFSTGGAQFIVMLTSKDGVILYVTGDLDSLSVQENFYNRPGSIATSAFLALAPQHWPCAKSGRFPSAEASTTLRCFTIRFVMQRRFSITMEK